MSPPAVPLPTVPAPSLLAHAPARPHRRWLPLALLLLVAAPVRAEVLLVPKQHGTIQAAVDAALPGDEIRIAGGHYAENVLLAGKTGLLLRGPGAVLDGGGADLALTLTGCSEIVVEGLTLTNVPAWPAVDVLGGSDVTFRRVRFTGCNYGLYATEVEGLVVERCRFDDLTGPGIYLELGADVLVTRSRWKGVAGGLDATGVNGLRGELLSLRGVLEDGLVADGFLLPSHDVTFERCKLRGIGGDGVRVEGDRAMIRDVVLAGGQETGIVLVGADGVVESCSVATTGESAVSGSGDSARFEALRLRTGFDGLSHSGAQVVVRDVKVVRPPGFGFRLNVPSGLVELCSATAPGREGFDVEGTGVILRSNRVKGAGPAAEDDAAFALELDGSTCEANLASGAAGDGFRLSGTGNTLSDNKAVGSGASGFRIEDGGNLLERNRAAKSGASDLSDDNPEGANTYVDNVFGTVEFGTIGR